jgi:3-hydroxyacyl-CoA dehydrogenase/enoyl-CoA hydratase/3-hydroxybutyryl-CoA epimerase
MGGDIAAVAALNGFSVSLSDREASAVEKAVLRAASLFERRLKTDKAIADANSRLIADVAGAHIGNADIIIEAVAERLEVKQAVFKEVEKAAKPGAILATNTSSIMIEDIAASLNQPERLIGLHFFNPVPVLPLVEVIFGAQSDSDVLARAMCFAGQLKKMPVKVKSVKGFLVNRALLPYIFKAICLMEDGESADKIDQAMVRFGMPMGPIELADQVGLDVCYDVGKVLGMPQAADNALAAKCGAAMLGRKTGSGFYDWEGKKALRERAVYPAAELDALAADLLAPMIDKCRTAVSGGVVASADDADIGCILGIGFPRYRGGPLGWADYPR